MVDRRWSDEKLESFYQRFEEHVAQEEADRRQQAEIHEALFQREDKDANRPAGVIQMLARLDGRTAAIEIATDRQKRFIGGVLFAFSCVGFLFTDTSHKVLNFLRGL